MFVVNCSSSSDDSSGDPRVSDITLLGSINSFGNIHILSSSEFQNIAFKGNNLASGIDLSVTQGFEISLNGNNFSNSLQISATSANNQNSVYVRFTPTELGAVNGTLSIVNAEVDNIDIALQGNGLVAIHKYIAFNLQRLAFGGGFDQSSAQTFNLHDDLTNIETIKMYVKLRCPSAGCDEWDVYANVKVKDEASGELYELGRYITPYWNDNSQLDRGFEFDVTDFKSLLTGSTELRIRTEC